ncbi:MAG TPA: Gfo/Idh/MocA family oxidoreductase [Candidatus Limnocylindria bacterium]|nr:Gfo/Idh/MocA family oxidoreductase [Candidatus Limnocylindria bacterium]
MKNKLRVGIIGAGLIGFKRAKAILELGQDSVVGVCDINQKRAEELGALTGAKVFKTWQDLVKAPNMDAVVVAAFHKDLPVMTIAAFKNSKHVLAEKTLGWDGKDAKRIYLASKKAGKVLKVGFNHRFHPAISKAHQMFKAGAIGEIMFIRAAYGHGGRPNYGLEWRLQKKYTRGGEMYDQGSHMTDLSLWFLKKFDKVFGNAKNYFWKQANLEDNAFCQLITKKGQTSSFQVSLTQWKNHFSFDIYGTKGYLLVHGLGRSYGVETLIYGSNVGKGKVPKEKIWEFPGEDISWTEEWKNFRQGIFQHKPVLSSGADNVEVLKIIDGLYESAASGKLIKI